MERVAKGVGYVCKVKITRNVNSVIAYVQSLNALDSDSDIARLNLKDTSNSFNMSAARKRISICMYSEVWRSAWLLVSASTRPVHLQRMRKNLHPTFVVCMCRHSIRDFHRDLR